LVLLFLLTAAWAADRSGRPAWAGALLGAAMAVKLFPGFLFLYFVARRRWRAVVAGTASFAAVTLLTAAVLGPGTYESYIRDVLPQVGQFRSGWLNLSLYGWWCKLFDANPAERVSGLMEAPRVAAAGAAACNLAVAVLAALVAWRARDRATEDLAFGTCVVAMLLVSPITWDHYLLFLLVPAAALAAWHRRRAPLLLLLAVFWFEPYAVWKIFWGPDFMTHVAGPAESVTLLSFQTYSLLALFVLLLTARPVAPPDAPPTALSFNS
jgi:hypothetical protein